MAGGVEGELPVEVGVQGVMGGREELVRVRPLLGGASGVWGDGGGGSLCRSGSVFFFFFLFSSE